MRTDDVETTLAILRLRLAQFTWRELYQVIHDLNDDDPSRPSSVLIRTCFLQVLDHQNPNDGYHHDSFSGQQHAAALGQSPG